MIFVPIEQNGTIKINLIKNHVFKKFALDLSS